MDVPREVRQEFKGRLARYTKGYREEVERFLDADSLRKHLPGGHDQATHSGEGGAGEIRMTFKEFALNFWVERQGKGKRKELVLMSPTGRAVASMPLDPDKPEMEQHGEVLKEGYAMFFDPETGVEKGTEPMDTLTPGPVNTRDRTLSGRAATPQMGMVTTMDTNEGVPGSRDDTDTRGAVVSLADAVTLLKEGAAWIVKMRHDPDSDLPVATIGKRGKRHWPSPLELVNREIGRTKKRIAGHCKSLWKDEIDLDDWHHMMQKEVDDLYGRSASAAVRRAKDIEGSQARARDDLLLEMRDQRRYLRKFRDELAVRGISEKRLIQRAKMYANGAGGLYHSVVSASLPIRKVYWRLMKGAKHCTDCLEMSDKSPFPSRNLPRLPRDGSTQCVANCKCYLDYGPAKKARIVRRKKGKKAKKA